MMTAGVNKASFLSESSSLSDNTTFERRKHAKPWFPSPMKEKFGRKADQLGATV
jgi:hypothetical protein